MVNPVDLNKLGHIGTPRHPHLFHHARLQLPALGGCQLLFESYVVIAAGQSSLIKSVQRNDDDPVGPVLQLGLPCPVQLHAGHVFRPHLQPARVVELRHISAVRRYQTHDLIGLPLDFDPLAELRLAVSKYIRGRHRFVQPHHGRIQKFTLIGCSDLLFCIAVKSHHVVIFIFIRYCRRILDLWQSPLLK